MIEERIGCLVRRAIKFLLALGRKEAIDRCLVKLPCFVEKICQGPTRTRVKTGVGWPTAAVIFRTCLFRPSFNFNSIQLVGMFFYIGYLELEGLMGRDHLYPGGEVLNFLITTPSVSFFKRLSLISPST